MVAHRNPPVIDSPASSTATGSGVWDHTRLATHDDDNVHTPQSDVSSLHTPQADLSASCLRRPILGLRPDDSLLSSTAFTSSDSNRQAQPASVFIPRNINRDQYPSFTLIPGPTGLNVTLEAMRDVPYNPSQNPLGGFRTRTEQPFHPPGIIGDRRQEPFALSNNAKPAQIPARGMPNMTAGGSSSRASSSDMSVVYPSAVTFDPLAPGNHYQPMANLNLQASGKTYHPGLIDGLNPAHPYASGLDDYVAQSMKQMVLTSSENGPVNHIRRNFSPKYQGDIFLPANQSENIPEEKNCSLFIVNLPPDLTTPALLAAIHRMGPLGRIFAIHINAPEPQRNHPGCAAKVVFFKRNVAHKFFNLCELNGFLVQGYAARVMWNRIKTSQKQHLVDSDASRVLLIGGPPNEVNSEALTNFFRQKLEFQIDRIITHVSGLQGKEDAVIEYRFGSFRCQAQAAKMALAREKPHIRCFFAKDPLEPEAYKPFEYFNFTDNI